MFTRDEASQSMNDLERGASSFDQEACDELPNLPVVLQWRTQQTLQRAVRNFHGGVIQFVEGEQSALEKQSRDVQLFGSLHIVKNDEPNGGVIHGFDGTKGKISDYIRSNRSNRSTRDGVSAPLKQLSEPQESHAAVAQLDKALDF